MPKKSKRYTLTDIMPFGKHRGSDFDEIMTEDPAYMEWLYNNSVVEFNEADAFAIEEELNIA